MAHFAKYANFFYGTDVDDTRKKAQ